MGGKELPWLHTPQEGTRAGEHWLTSTLISGSHNILFNFGADEMAVLQSNSMLEGVHAAVALKYKTEHLHLPDTSQKVRQLLQQAC